MPSPHVNKCQRGLHVDDWSRALGPERTAGSGAPSYVASLPRALKLNWNSWQIIHAAGLCGPLRNVQRGVAN